MSLSFLLVQYVKYTKLAGIQFLFRNHQMSVYLVTLRMSLISFLIQCVKYTKLAGTQVLFGNNQKSVYLVTLRGCP
jgi:hypothetical protein